MKSNKKNNHEAESPAIPLRIADALAAAKTKARILITDDEPEIVALLAEELQRDGYEIIRAFSGAECLALCLEQRPDLLLLDVVLPDLSGLEVCRRIKADPELPDTFIILMSGQMAALENKVAGLHVGADEYLLKPFVLAEVVARVESMLRIQQAQKALAAAQAELELRVQQRTAQLAEANRLLSDEIGERQKMEEVLREGEERFRTLFEFAPIGIALHAPDGRVLHTNLAYQQMLGYSEEELQKFGIEHAMHPDDIEPRRKLFEELRGGDRQQYRRQRRFLKKDGSLVWAQVATCTVRDPNRNLRFIISMVEDITWRREEEEKLRATEAELRRVMASVPNYLWSGEVDPQGNFGYLYYSPVVKKITGRPPEFFLAGPDRWLSTVAPEDRERMLKVSLRLRDGRSTHEDEEYRIIHPNGTVRWVRDNVVATRSPDGSRRFDGIVADITERKVAEQALRQSEQRLREASARILEAQEAERRRVARDLHDSVNQLLSSVRFRIQTLEEKIDDPKLLREARTARELLHGALNEVRRISRNLRPSELDDLGLPAAVRSACLDFKTRTRTMVDLHLPKLRERLPPEIELAFYRIVQEALSNVEKHAQASRLSLHLVKTKSRIHLRIRDNGKGFSLRRKKGRDRGLGLENIRERASFAGGQCVVKTSAKGTEILVRIPVQAPKAKKA